MTGHIRVFGFNKTNNCNFSRDKGSVKCRSLVGL